MSWTVTRIPDTEVLLLEYIGRLTQGELEISAFESLAQLRATGYSRLLADCSRLEGGHSITDLFLLAARVAMHYADLAHVREAVIMPQSKGTAELARFWQTTTRNRGMQVQVFEDRESALAWLQRA